MAIKVYTASEVRKLNIPKHTYGRTTKYPWYQIEKGGAFFVPRSLYKREDYRPPVPAKLRDEGYKIVTTKYVQDKTPGLLIKRIA